MASVVSIADGIELERKRESERLLKAYLDLEKSAEWLYHLWATSAGNPEPWHNLMPRAMEAWREVARAFLAGECPRCGEELICVDCDDTDDASA